MIRESPSFATVLAAAAMPASAICLASSSTPSRSASKPQRCLMNSTSLLGKNVPSVRRGISMMSQYSYQKHSFHMRRNLRPSRKRSCG